MPKPSPHEAASLPQPGQIAKIRQRTYLVESITKPKRAPDSTLVELSCVDDDNQGAPLAVLWEKELDPEVLTAETWEQIGSKGFDPADLFAAYLNTDCSQQRIKLILKASKMAFFPQPQSHQTIAINGAKRNSAQPPGVGRPFRRIRPAGDS
ncbi:MAG: hypothetical protein ACK5SA_00010 [Planctomycetota bacterium]|jgi:hypothetical protein